jgi:hypothetical protein
VDQVLKLVWTLLLEPLQRLHHGRLAFHEEQLQLPLAADGIVLGREEPLDNTEA